MPHQLVFYPDYRAANPYQTLLYAHSAPELHPRPGTIAEALALRAQQAPTAGMIFHLHWEDAVYRNEPGEAAARAAVQAFLADLERFVDGGGMLVWTLHNAAPHDDKWPGLQEELRTALLRLVDLVHVHSYRAAGWARSQLEIAPERLVVVPHGNYLPLYREVGRPRAVSRAELGVPVEARLALLFGRLDAYKGGAELLRALARLDHADLHLLIAGRQVAPLDAELAQLPEGVRGRVHVEPGVVPDARVPLLFHAADALVAPYRAVLTSGAAMLALSLARPVIGPALAGLQDLVDDGVEGLLYDPAAPSGLATALERFLGLEGDALAALGTRARARAALYDWRISGNLLGGALTRLLELRRPMRRLS